MRQADSKQMKSMAQIPQGKERRNYIRMDTVLPVQFRLTSLDGKIFLSDWHQGFTNNVGKGGICLRINNLNPYLVRQMRNKEVKVAFEIELPLLSGSAITAQASISWFQDIERESAKCLVGLRYDIIDEYGKSRIMRYAKAKKIFLPAVTTVIVLLGTALAVDSYVNFKQVEGNKMLVRQLIKVIQESNITKEQLKQINKETERTQMKFQELESRIKSVEEEKAALRVSVEKEKSEAGKKVADLSGEIERLYREKDILRQQLYAFHNKETAATQELERLDKEKSALAQVNFHKMAQWLTVHQNARTGLVMSFEGDENIGDQAFIYDQSLAAQVYLHVGDDARARKILDFFVNTARRENGLFFNSYYVNDGSPAEYVVHSGPNIWIGIAVLQYAHKTKDARYVPLAEEIARSIMYLQAQDKDGGLRGGPSLSWYATEHNLDAYAFLNMLFVITGNPQYAAARDKTFKWLLLHSYDTPGMPITRGKGDSTIATDTYAWSIAAIGPAKLKESGMDPDKILEFAENKCTVTVSYTRPDGETITVKGFDFAPQRHLSRGGVISTEWTAQMITAFKIMRVYYQEQNDPGKAALYLAKADEYLGHLCNMIICSPSPSGQGEGCLPYASIDFVDSGHGWKTPKGKNTGSVSGTAYTFFAYYGYNPLELK